MSKIVLSDAKSRVFLAEATSAVCQNRVIRFLDDERKLVAVQDMRDGTTTVVIDGKNVEYRTETVLVDFNGIEIQFP